MDVDRALEGPRTGSSKIVPESGNPKLDLIVNLADVLDWNVGDVAESVRSGTRARGRRRASIVRDAQPGRDRRPPCGPLRRGDRTDPSDAHGRDHPVSMRSHASARAACGSAGRYTRSNARRRASRSTARITTWRRRSRAAWRTATTPSGISSRRGRCAGSHRSPEHADLSDPVIHENRIAHYARGHATRRTLSTGPDATPRESDAAVDHLRRAI